MKRRTINAVILIGVLSIISILLVQVFWINRTIRAQRDAIVIQEKQDSLNTRKFEESVRIALKNAVEEIEIKLVDSSDVYGAVKQKSPNYFLVDINEDLHPYYLEQVLKRNFYESNITQNFQYGIYDCYNDSMVYGNLIRFTKDSLYSPISDSIAGITSPKLKWTKDGHYFTVYFPDFAPADLSENPLGKSPWIYVAIIVAVTLAFFAFAISVIIRQKRISGVKTDFINNMTHELKTPIATIGLSSEMLLKNDFSNDEERLKRYAKIIFKENKRLESQVERVLDMAKIDKDELVLQLESIDLQEVLSEIASDFRFNRGLENEAITLNLAAEKHHVRGDLVHITNIFINLLDNAVKYSLEEPRIEINSINRAAGIEISFKDHGIGIDKNQLPLVFDQFYRVPTGNLHDVKGFGLGLYYVKIIVEKHKGKITVHSKHGEGTTFKIWLPTLIKT